MNENGQLLLNKDISELHKVDLNIHSSRDS